jgi:hypothetical protein
MQWQPVGCVLHGNKVKSFNWTLSTFTTLCLIYITEQQVTPRRSNVYVSSQLSFFLILPLNILEFRYFCSDVTFDFFCISNLLHCQRRIQWKLVEIIHISPNLDSSLRWFATNYTDRVPILARVYLRHGANIHFLVPGKRGRKALRSSVECLES